MAPRTPGVLLEQARTARREGRANYARNLLRKALKESRGTQDPFLRAELHIRLAQVERDSHNLETAERHYRTAVEMLRHFENPQKLAHTVRHLADILREEGKLSEAAPLYSEALDLYREADGTTPLDLANAIRGFALLKAELEERKEAICLWQAAKDPYEQVGVEAGVEESAMRISALQCQQGIRDRGVSAESDRRSEASCILQAWSYSRS
jgi:tetratricopeptide (TPR) repeat protein